MTKKMTRRHFVGGIAAGASAASLSAGWPTASYGDEKTIKVGWIGPMTGPLSSWGLPGTYGCGLWAEMINAEGGLKVGNDRYEVQVVTYDDEYDPAKSLAGVKKLINEDDVKFIVQLGGPPVTSVQPYLTKQKVMNSTLGPLILSPERPYLFALSEPWPLDVGMSVTWFTRKHPEIKKVAIAGMNEYDILQAVAACRAAFEIAGVEIVHENLYTFETVDFAPVVSAMLAEKPDLLCWSGSYPDYVNLLCSEAYVQGWRGPMISATAGDYKSIMQKTSPEFMEGFGFVYPQLDDPALRDINVNFPNPSEFLRIYQERWPGAWNESAWTYASSLSVWKTGVEAAGSAESDDVIAALTSMKSVPHFFGSGQWWGKELYGIDNHLIGFAPMVEIRNGQPTIDALLEVKPWLDIHFDRMKQHMEALDIL